MFTLEQKDHSLTDDDFKSFFFKRMFIGSNLTNSDQAVWRHTASLGHISYQFKYVRDTTPIIDISMKNITLIDINY